MSPISVWKSVWRSGIDKLFLIETNSGKENITKENKCSEEIVETKEIEGERHFSFWKILFVVFSLLILWNLFYRSLRHEIPLGKLLESLEQIDREGAEEDPSESSLVEVSNERCETLSIFMDEGIGKKKKRIHYFDFAEICVSTYEITGSVMYEVVASPSGKTTKRARKVEFYSGRQGLEIEAEYLLDVFQKAGITDVRAKGVPNVFQKYGIVLFTVVLIAGILLLCLKKIEKDFGKGGFTDVGREYEQVDVSFQDVAGVDEAIEELKEIVDFLRSPKKYQELGGRIPKGVLLVGAPGTGKTLLAKAVAGEAGVPFYSLSGSDFVELYAGMGAARVRSLFQKVESSSPSIIFIDELDALGKSRVGGISDGGNEEREQTLNALLVEMDGFEQNSGAIVLAATNRPETLDSALLRPGRFDRQILVDRPDVGGREAILKIHLKNVKTDPNFEVKKLASLTSGFVGAELANLVNEAALLAARREKTCVSEEEFSEAFERVVAGLAKKRSFMSEKEKKRIACHESGHALVAYFLPDADPVHKISIVPRGLNALGYTLQRSEEERYISTKKELESNIAVLLGGSLAEELYLGETSTGAQNDIERATDVARSMVVSYGMSSLGRVNYHTESSLFLNVNDRFVQNCSEETAREVDLEVRKIVATATERCRKIILDHMEALIRASDRLFLVETMNGEELHNLIEDIKGTSDSGQENVSD